MLILNEWGAMLPDYTDYYRYLLRMTVNTMESLANLIFLAKHEAHDPQAVKKYLQVAEDCLEISSRKVRQHFPDA